MSLTRNSEKIATIVNAVDCRPTWSDKRIAAETHTSRTVVWEIRRYILHEQHRRRGRERNPAETEAQIISLLQANFGQVGLFGGYALRAEGVYHD
jgi:hypothetical protein